MSSPPTILMMPGAIGLAPLTRLLLVADALHEQGAIVVFAYREAHELLQQSPFALHLVPDVKPTDLTGTIYDLYDEALLAQCVKREMEVIEEVQPDAVVGDLRPSAAISTHLARVPYISVVHASMTDAFDPVYAMATRDMGTLSNKAASFLAQKFLRQQKRALVTPLRQVARAHKLTHLREFDDFFSGALTLLPDLPEFCPLPSLPSTYRYVGPLVWEGRDPTLPAYLQKRDDERLLIYATTGNTDSRALIEQVVDIFGNDPYFEVLLTTGAFIDPATIAAPRNIHVERFVPGSAAMAKAQLAIHCGGNGALYQALGQGVPALAIPFNNDQKINAMLLQRHGLGVANLLGSLQRAHLKLRLLSLLNNKEVHGNLVRFQFLLAGANGPRSAAREILALVGR